MTDFVTRFINRIHNEYMKRYNSAVKGMNDRLEKMEEMEEKSLKNSGKQLSSVCYDEMSENHDTALYKNIFENRAGFSSNLYKYEDAIHDEKDLEIIKQHFVAGSLKGLKEENRKR